MFLCYRELCAETGVRDACWLSHDGKEFLVVARNKVVEMMRIGEGDRLVREATFNLAGRISSVQALPFGKVTGGDDVLVVCCVDGKMALVAFDKDSKELRTISIHDLAEEVQGKIYGEELLLTLRGLKSWKSRREKMAGTDLSSRS